MGIKKEMREIKFRAIIKERNATIYFDLSDLIHPARKDLFSKRELLIPWLLAGNKPDEYTGLKDKNGKEIYEGDIAKAFRRDDDGVIHYQFQATVVWSNTGLNWNIWAPSESDFWWGVIGNIYENPDLLESK